MTRIRLYRPTAMIALAIAAWVATDSPTLGEGCPAGTVQIDVHEEETADEVIVHRTCQELSCRPPPAPPPGAVSPGMFVTQEQCTAASAKLAALVQQRDKFLGKIRELDSWRRQLREHEKEFAAMRAEATEDLAWEFIDHVPVTQALDALRNVPALKKLDIDKIKAAYNATKALLHLDRAVATTDDKERIRQIINGARALGDAGMDFYHVDEQTRALLVALSKVIGSGVVVATASGQDTRDMLKTTMAVVEVLEPWWGLAILTEHGAERAGEYHYAGIALASLHEAQGSNWNARRYLAGKVDRLTAHITEEHFLMVKYQQADH